MRTSVLTQTRRPAASAANQVGNRYLQRRCACGQHTIGGATCDSCKSKKKQLFQRPGKAVGEQPDDYGEERPRPRNGSATIQCNGSGGYEIDYGTWAGATCGTMNCVTAHESTHIADWQAKWPDGCKGQAKGYLPAGHPPDNPVISRDDYKKFLKDSECSAHTADLDCAKKLPKPANCKKTVDDYIDLTTKQKESWNCGMSTFRKVLIGLGIAALGVGAYYGGRALNWF
jgi:hypothetical protein